MCFSRFNTLFKNDAPFVSPDHVSMPLMPEENELLYEVQTMVIFVISMCTQYLNLFRTFWWLSDNYRRYAMVCIKFISLFLKSLLLEFSFNKSSSGDILFIYCGQIISCSFFVQSLLSIYMCVCLFNLFDYFLHHAALSFHEINQINQYLPSFARRAYVYLSTGIIFLVFTYAQVYLLFRLAETINLNSFLIFFYPIAIYCIIHFPNIRRAYIWIRDGHASRSEICLELANFFLLPISISSCFPAVNHVCTNASPFYIRDEVEKLKNIFNDRLKFIVFRSIFVAYYGSFVPVMMAPDNLEYDNFWSTQHIGITWMSTFFMLTSHLYSPQFYDILHQSSLHLGKWQKLETRNTLIPCCQWIDTAIYGPGVVVRHSKEYYKSEANMTCAEPGINSHNRFFVSKLKLFEIIYSLFLF